MMGDGCINNGSKNPSLQAEMIRPNYLRHVDGVFGVLGCGVKMKETGKEAAQRMEDSGLYEASYEADPNNFHDVYVWRSVRHPTYREFRKWYSSGGKVWPDDIELTQ